ncbi:mammalian cell entry protein [Croceibacterium mercuriale]|uniref:Mammalian cell entry protein n=1 Tax=Croceibacterium mercuriale TaxID=1572751 RepID=A0A0B2BZL4_9SPHN|nr:MlaD family protein [Croceibacterium mercuriale]KHL25290.1 mammalian cell entry protein [Croceibacterium mercuriale]
METRANYVWVGVVTLLLLAALAAFFIWLARLNENNQTEYDIFFQQSVAGLAKGSEVSYSGVPVGQVSDIDLWQAQFVKVRISVDADTPILQGTTASVSSSFTGVSTIALNGGPRGNRPITCNTSACPEGVPVIPPRASGLGEILASAPLLLERLATLTDRLTRVLSDDNQESIRGILANTSEISGSLAQTSPEIGNTLRELQGTLQQSQRTLGAFETTLNSTNEVINGEGRGLADELRQTLVDAGSAAKALEATLNSSQPAINELTETTLPAADATLQDLRRTSAAARAIMERIETEGAGSLVRGAQLPTYKP